jgi:predicted transcriptional regulator
MLSVKVVWRVTLINTLHTKQSTLTTLSNIGTSIGYNGTSYTTAAVNPNYSMGDNVLTVNNNPASLDVKGKMILNGQDLEERLKTIEKVLMIPERDVTMEAKYPSLKKKYDEYIKELSKYRMWDTIKGDS